MNSAGAAMKKKTIMHLRRNREIGGAEKYILLVANKLDSSKYDVVVTAFGYRDNPRVALIQRAEEQGTQSDIIRPLGRYSPFCVSDLVALLRKHQVDLLHTHDHKSTLPGILAARWVGIPVVTTVHGIEKYVVKTKLNQSLGA